MGIITPSGGHAGLLADRARAQGLELPDPSPETVETIGRELPDFGRAQNPLDVTGMVINQPPLFNRALEAFLGDPTFGCVLLNAPAIRRLEEFGVSVVRGAHVGLGALRGVLAATDAAPRGRERPIDPARAAGLRAELEEERRRGIRTLGERASKRVLEQYGIRVPSERLAASGTEVVEAAQALGFPVAIKVSSPDLPHKSEVGGVRLNLASPEAVARAYREIVAAVSEGAPGARVDGVLVARMCAGVEVLAGVSCDPQFGPVATLALGGVWVEALEDSALSLIPLTEGDARAMIAALRGARILTGWRGRPGADLGAVVETLLALSQLARELEGVIEAVDINPLIVGPAGTGVWAADALVVLAEPS